MLDGVTLGKLGLGLGSAALLVLLGAGEGRLDRLTERSFTALFLGLSAASRLGIFTLLFVILGLEPQSDVPVVYYPQAREALLGHVPYRDFPSSYAPLFPYLEAGALRVWDDPRSLILLAILIELASLPLWLRVGRSTLGERPTRLAALLYLTSPVILVNVGINGQNQVFCSFFLALSLWLGLRGRPFLAGLALGAPLVAVKLLALILAPPALAAAGPGKLRWALGFSLLPLAVYGPLALAGVDVLFPLRFEYDHRSSGNLPFLFTALGSPIPDLAWTLLLGAALIALGIACLRRVSGPAAAMPWLTLFVVVFLLLSKKAFSHYLAMAWFPVCLTLAVEPRGRLSLLLIGLAGAVATLEPTLWNRWLLLGDFASFPAPAGEGPPPAALRLFLLGEIALLGAYAALGWLSWAQIRARRSTLPPAPPVG